MRLIDDQFLKAVLVFKVAPFHYSFFLYFCSATFPAPNTVSYSSFPGKALKFSCLVFSGMIEPIVGQEY